MAKRQSHRRSQVTSPVTIEPAPPDDKASVNAVLERLEQERQHPAIRLGAEALMQIAWVDSKKQKFRCEQQVAFTENSSLKKGGDRWMVY